jgi:hypothetical protein
LKKQKRNIDDSPKWTTYIQDYACLQQSQFPQELNAAGQTNSAKNMSSCQSVGKIRWIIHLAEWKRNQRRNLSERQFNTYNCRVCKNSKRALSTSGQKLHSLNETNWNGQLNRSNSQRDWLNSRLIKAFEYGLSKS